MQKKCRKQRFSAKVCACVALSTSIFGLVGWKIWSFYKGPAVACTEKKNSLPKAALNSDKRPTFLVHASMPRGFEIASLSAGCRPQIYKSPTYQCLPKHQAHASASHHVPVYKTRCVAENTPCLSEVVSARLRPPAVVVDAGEAFVKIKQAFAEAFSNLDLLKVLGKYTGKNYEHNYEGFYADLLKCYDEQFISFAKHYAKQEEDSSRLFKCRQSKASPRPLLKKQTVCPKDKLKVDNANAAVRNLKDDITNFLDMAVEFDKRKLSASPVTNEEEKAFNELKKKLRSQNVSRDWLKRYVMCLLKAVPDGRLKTIAENKRSFLISEQLKKQAIQYIQWWACLHQIQQWFFKSEQELADTYLSWKAKQLPMFKQTVCCSEAALKKAKTQVKQRFNSKQN